MPNYIKKTCALVRGRGALENPSGRFEALSMQDDPDLEPQLDDDGNVILEEQVKTQIFIDRSKSILSTNDSPDLRMDTTLNPYRGCEHGCIYCFARPTHEYMGLSAGLDFETKIFAKPDAPKLLEERLRSKNWEPRTIVMSGVTDPYQPIEKKLGITRACLEVLVDYLNPVSFITKNVLITRDIDLLKRLAEYNAVCVNMSVTTLDRHVCRLMEPRASTPTLRLKAIETLSNAGIPVNVIMGPVVPGLTEHEIPTILESAANAGARSASYTMLRLPYGVKDLFQTWLQEHFPDRSEKVLNRLRSMRDGKLYNADFATRLTGEGFYADQIAMIFQLARKKHGLTNRISLSTEHFRRDARNTQMTLF